MPSRVFESVADLHRHLEVVDLVTSHVSAYLLDLKPIDVPVLNPSTPHCVADRLLDGFRRCAHDFAQAVHPLGHGYLLSDGQRADRPARVYLIGVSEPTHTITSAQRALSDEQSSRTRKYLISMGIRTACVIGAIFIPGWPRWVLIAGAVVLPYLAVVIANAGKSRDEGSADPVPMEVQPARPALPSSTKALEGVIIVPAEVDEPGSGRTVG